VQDVHSMPARHRPPGPRHSFRLRSERALRTTASATAAGTPIGISRAPMSLTARWSPSRKRTT